MSKTKDKEGLLQFCYEATRRDDAPNPQNVLKEMDPQRLKLLEEALAGMSLEMVEKAANGMKILNNRGEDLKKKQQALDYLVDWVVQNKMASNYYKIGGFTALQSCLESPHPSLRAGASHLAAECSQNGPYCQEKFVKENFLNHFVEQLDKDEDIMARVKALYAISCICRDNSSGLSAFASLNGWSVILRAIQSNNNKLRIKACFFVTAVAPGDDKIQEELVELGFVEQLTQLLQEPHSETHEHVMSGLVSLARNNKAARDRVATEQVAKLLMERQTELEGREECEEEVEYCKELARLCFKRPNDGGPELKSDELIPIVFDATEFGKSFINLKLKESLPMSEIKKLIPKLIQANEDTFMLYFKNREVEILQLPGCGLWSTSNVRYGELKCSLDP